GQRLRLSGKGEAAPRGGAPGNLFVDIHVAEDERFKRDGADVYSMVSVSYTIAALGGTVEIPTLDDHVTGSAELDVEPGTQPGTVHVRKGAGIARLDGYGRGNHIVEVTVEVPKRLNDRQKELIRELAAAGGEEPAAEPTRTFFGRKRKKS